MLKGLNYFKSLPKVGLTLTSKAFLKRLLKMVMNLTYLIPYLDSSCRVDEFSYIMRRNPSSFAIGTDAILLSKLFQPWSIQALAIALVSQPSLAMWDPCGLENSEK